MSRPRRSQEREEQDDGPFQGRPMVGPHTFRALVFAVIIFGAVSVKKFVVARDSAQRPHDDGARDFSHHYFTPEMLRVLERGFGSRMKQAVSGSTPPNQAYAIGLKNQGQQLAELAAAFAKSEGQGGFPSGQGKMAGRETSGNLPPRDSPRGEISGQGGGVATWGSPGGGSFAAGGAYRGSQFPAGWSVLPSRGGGSSGVPGFGTGVALLGIAIGSVFVWVFLIKGMRRLRQWATDSTKHGEVLENELEWDEEKVPLTAARVA